MIENRMLIDGEWKWAKHRAIQHDLKWCECEERISVIEYNGQRFCTRCAVDILGLEVE